MLSSASCVVYLMSLCALFQCSQQSLSSLRFVHVIFRHGDRTPSKTYPNDFYQENFWPNGWKQLTTKGMRQAFELGQYLRTRYDGFILPKYNRDEVYVRSTDTDRTLQSAQCLLTGFYPPTKGEIWRDGVSWQPVPIHTVPKAEDPLLKVSKYACPTLARRHKTFTKAEARLLDQQYASILEYLGERTGFAKFTSDHIGAVYSPLFVQREHGLPWPEWVNESVWDQIVELKRIRRYMKYDDHIESRLSGGYLVGDIMTRMKQVASGDRKDRLKMRLYSAHDSTLLALLGAFKISNYLLPPYATSLMVELHEPLPGEFRVALWLRNSTTHDPYPMQVRGCNSTVCELHELDHVLSDMTLSDQPSLDHECGLVKPLKCKVESRQRTLQSMAIRSQPDVIPETPRSVADTDIQLDPAFAGLQAATAVHMNVATDR